MTEPATPPSDEYDTFRRLAQKLIAVPKKEVDQRAADDKASKEDGERRPKRARRQNGQHR